MKKMYIIDGNSLIYRAFFAVPGFTTAKGLPTNAIYGFSKMLMKLIRDNQPDNLVVVFDAKGPTFRTQIMEEYKAHRPKMPDNLVIQKPYIRQVVDLFRLPVFEIAGIEADDVIGTLTNTFSQTHQIVIVTGDKDLMQLIDKPTITIYDSMKELRYDREGVYKKMGVYPEQIIDLLALMGDTSDNIPGVQGIGPKTALSLLEKYHSFKGVYDHIETIEGSVHEKLIKDKEIAEISYTLATIKTDVPLDISAIVTEYLGPDIEKLYQLFDELEFSSLKKELFVFGGLDKEIYDTKEKKVYEKRYCTVTDQKMFDTIIAEIEQKKEFAFDTETTSLDPHEAELAGISLSYNQHIGYYIPLGHKNYDNNLDKHYVLEKIFTLLNNEDIKKIGHNIKFDVRMLEEAREKLDRILVFSSPKKQEKQMNLFV